MLVHWCHLCSPFHQGGHRPEPAVVCRPDLLCIHDGVGCGRFVVCPPRDRSTSGLDIVVDVLVGAVAGVFLAAPAIAI